MDQRPLQQFVATVRPASWAIAVSGGADSVALLSLLLDRRSDLALHVVHFDHHTREGQSAQDAAFVRQLALDHGLPFSIATRDQIEPDLAARMILPRNLSARFRALRYEWFRRVVAAANLGGVILAHHADDQAETVLL